jgi:ABC-type amino acid transport substrate-binding protein
VEIPFHSFSKVGIARVIGTSILFFYFLCLNSALMKFLTKHIYLVCIAGLTLISSLGAQNSSTYEDTLLIGYYESPPFVINPVGSTPVGVSSWLWERIDRELGIPYTLIRMPLDSMLQSLATGRIDMSLNPLTITSERMERFDFSQPFYISNASLLTNRQSPWARARQFLASFFSLSFFQAIGALFVVIFIFGFLAWIFERRANPEEFPQGWKGIWSGVWWSAVTMTTVGYGDKSPRSTGGRIIALVWMFTAIIIISGFTASIASSLTVNQLGANRSQITAFKDVPLATVSASATEEWLRKHFFNEIRTYPDLDACQEALANGEVKAVAYDQPLLQYLARRDTLDEVEVLPLTFNRQLYAFGLSDSLSYNIREEISVDLLRITESTDWDVLLNEYGLHQE